MIYPVRDKWLLRNVFIARATCALGFGSYLQPVITFWEIKQH